MSRPSTTIRSAVAMISRCCATRTRRTAGTAATADTAPVTSGPRISRSTATASSRVVGFSGSVPMTMRASIATLATASASDGSTPACSTARVTARYMAPVSRYRAPRAAASRRDTVDLPAPDGTGYLGKVRLGHAERRVHQPVRQLAVVGQQQQALAVGVEPADVEDPLRYLTEIVGQRRPAPFVVHRRDHPAGLVHREVHQ